MAQLHFYLDARKLRKDGTAPLKLSVYLSGARAMIPTEITLQPQQWDAASERVVNHPRRRSLNTYLDGYRADAGDVLRELARSRQKPTADMIRKAIQCGGVSASQPTFLDIYHQVMDAPTIKPRTREIYAATLKKVTAYMDSQDGDIGSLTFEDITRSWLGHFDTWLMDTSPSRNARNIHLRNIRHVCNVAVADHATTFYDFRGYSIKGVPTVKRSVPADKLRAFFSLDVEPHQQKYLDVFKLIFYMIGINTVDLCHLKKSDIKDGRIEYHRAKTGRYYSIRIEPEAEDIIKRYEGNGDWMLDIMDRYTDFKDYAHRLNENLQKMGEVEVGKHGKKTRAPMFPSITTYWARHSWATIAASLDIPNETIAAALGHGYGNRITAIYIDFDTRKVDAANRRVLDWVLYGKK